MIRRGRPLGPLARSVLAYAAGAGRIDSLGVAQSLQLSRAAAVRTVYGLRAAGYLVEVDRVQHAAARRPLIVCEPAPAAPRECAPAAGVLQQWPRR